MLLPNPTNNPYVPTDAQLRMLETWNPSTKHISSAPFQLAVIESAADPHPKLVQWVAALPDNWSAIAIESVKWYADAIGFMVDALPGRFDVEEQDRLEQAALALLNRQLQVWDQQKLTPTNSVWWNRIGASIFRLGFVFRDVIPPATLNNLLNRWADVWGYIRTYWKGGMSPEGVTYAGQGGLAALYHMVEIAIALTNDREQKNFYINFISDTLAGPRFLKYSDGRSVTAGDNHTQIYDDVVFSLQSFPSLKEVAFLCGDFELIQRLGLHTPGVQAPLPVWPWGRTSTPYILTGLSFPTDEWHFEGAGLVVWKDPVTDTHITLESGALPDSHRPSVANGNYSLYRKGYRYVGDAHGYAEGATSPRVFFGRQDNFNQPRILIEDSDFVKTKPFNIYGGRQTRSFAFSGQKMVGSGYSSHARSYADLADRAEEYGQGGFIYFDSGPGWKFALADLSPSYGTFPGAEPWQAVARANVLRGWLWAGETLFVIDWINPLRADLVAWIRFHLYSERSPTMPERNELVSMPRAWWTNLIQGGMQPRENSELHKLRSRVHAVGEGELELDVTGVGALSYANDRQQPAYRAKPEVRVWDPGYGPSSCANYQVDSFADTKLNSPRVFVTIHTFLEGDAVKVLDSSFESVRLRAVDRVFTLSPGGVHVSQDGSDVELREL